MKEGLLGIKSAFVKPGNQYRSQTGFKLVHCHLFRRMRVRLACAHFFRSQHIDASRSLLCCGLPSRFAPESVNQGRIENVNQGWVAERPVTSAANFAAPLIEAPSELRRCGWMRPLARRVF